MPHSVSIDSGFVVSGKTSGVKDKQLETAHIHRCDFPTLLSGATPTDSTQAYLHYVHNCCVTAHVFRM